MDASFDEDNLKGTTGVVVRDSKGKFIAANNSKIDTVLDVLSVEAMALKEGFLLLNPWGVIGLSLAQIIWKSLTLCKMRSIQQG